MAEPTLKGVIAAIAKLETTVDKRFDEIDKRFDALDKEVTLHANVHREMEKDITALKARPPRTGARPTRRPRAR
jgi:hypothetical protein